MTPLTPHGATYKDPHDVGVPAVWKAIDWIGGTHTRLGIDAKLARADNWKNTDDCFRLNSGFQITACLYNSDDAFKRDFLDRYGRQIAVVDAVNEPPDAWDKNGIGYKLLRNEIWAWQRVMAGRSYQPILSAPSNTNTTDTFAICLNLQADGLLQLIGIIDSHEYLGTAGNGDERANPHGPYIHPDQPYNENTANYLGRMLRLSETFGKPLSHGEFALNPFDLRDAAIYAAMFQKLKLHSVILHWPHQKIGTTPWAHWDYATNTPSEPLRLYCDLMRL